MFSFNYFYCLETRELLNQTTEVLLPIIRSIVHRQRNNDQWLRLHKEEKSLLRVQKPK